ncbi:MAG: NifB/NifX family molybdenum-iron cluster-binding protein [Anaerolineales bacterium]|nr:NifB/NifX family molybdenum-iron cluster-binding protein [Anaerolineales bacterium]
MKIVLTTTSADIKSAVDPRFGRGAYFLIVDTESGAWEAQANPGVNASGGAGVQAAQFVVACKAGAVVSGAFGPNAFDALKAVGIQMVLYGDCQTAEEALERYKAGTLEQATAPQSGGHRGRA